MGELVLERFRVEQKLGSGGFGTVYRAWDRRLERDVAVKLIDGEAGPRVLREAQAAARLNHPGIVTLYELGEEGGNAVLVSELVEGRTLRQLTRDGALSDRDVGEIGADLCEALDHAHARGVVHRDIKPQNVLVCEREPLAKLMDFGIARMVGGTTLTATGNVVGTLAYMAPEQAEGRAVGPEADVFALALTLYECWSGENPHLRDSPAATARAIGSRLTSLRHHRPDLPDPIVAAVDIALDPDPERRPSLEALGTALESSLEELDDCSAVPHRRGPSLAGLIEGSRLRVADLACAAALSGLVAAAMIGVERSGPSWAFLLVPIVAALALLRPRLGYLAAAFGLSAWLGLAVDRPGAALVLAAIAVPPVFLLRDADRALVLPTAAPALGALGIAAAFPAVAALAEDWRQRALIAATGFVWLAIAEAVLRRQLLFGPALEPARGWQESVTAAFGELLLPLATQPSFLAGLAIWAGAAVLIGIPLDPLRAWLDRAHGRGGRRLGDEGYGSPAPTGGGGGRPASLP